MSGRDGTVYGTTERTMDGAIWPWNRVGEALSALCQRAGMTRGAVANPAISAIVGPDGQYHLAAVERWITAAGHRLGVDAHSVSALYQDVDELLVGAAPALVRHPKDGFIVALAYRAGKLLLLERDGETRWAPVAAVRRELVAWVEGDERVRIRSALDAVGLASGRRARAEDALLGELMSGLNSGLAWPVRLPPHAPFWSQLGTIGMAGLSLALLAVHAVQYALFLLSWWTIGSGLLSGRLSWGWLTAWALLLLSLVPLRMATTWLQGRISIGVGALLRRRLLAGALRLSPDSIRHEGAGALLGRALESAAVEQLALGGGFA
ncbi:MAG: hypothetical protein AAGC55_27240, partial [Myxococcota bacterium]